jgi:hypothetical protein
MSDSHDKSKGIGCGVFLILIGIALVADRMGWISFKAVWFLPAVLIALGVGEVFDALRK